ncbi:MAG: hypothetical protein JNJ61_10720 [Anaerolineae bacterium]|nr:hypothetical protein [Anaerolineae bacterium]
MDIPEFRQEFDVGQGRVVDVPLSQEEREQIGSMMQKQQIEESTRKQKQDEEDALKAGAAEAAKILDAAAPTTLEEAIQHIEAYKALLKWFIRAARHLGVQP